MARTLEDQSDDNSQGSQLEFQRMLENLPAGAYTCDSDGLITYYNQLAVQLWGREPKLNDPIDRFCGSFKLFAVDGSPLRHDQCWMALALQTGEGYNRQEIIVERPDGSRINALAHANPIRDRSGKLIGAFNVLVDINEQKRADELQALLASIVDTSDDAIVSKTLTGQIRSWNKGAERLFGFTAKEAIGSQITLIIPPELHDEEAMILGRLRRGEQIEHFETTRVTKDGKRIEVSLSVSPLRDASGRITGASKIARDITAKKQDEADLQRLHEMSRRLAATLDLRFILEETLRTAVAIEGAGRGLLAICESDGSQLRVKASIGFADDFLRWIENSPLESTVSGKCFQSRQRVIVTDVEREPLSTSFHEVARQTGFNAVHSTPLITRSGKLVGVLSTHFCEPHNPSERVIRLIDLCVHQAVDFIENARLCDQLREADRFKDEFLATLAHELRNPLAPISNCINLVRLSDELSPAVGQVSEILEQQVSYLVRIVDDLLDVSRISRGKLELRKEPVELSAIIGMAVQTSKPLIEAAGHQLAVGVPPQSLVLDADAIRLSQVITNLLNNAAKYMDRGGQIWLTAQQTNDDVLISIRDKGLGITSDMLSRIFDMFTQVDYTLGRSRGGLGIGLSLAKRLVELHDGSIEVRSDGLGKGSEFTIRLPLSHSVSRPLARISSPQTDMLCLPSHRILVVDDTQAAVYVLGKLLERIGQSVHTAQNATAALEYIRAERPDIVISDIGMPNIDGCEMARQIRQDAQFDDMILVALTGFGQDSDRQKTREAGFDYHLVKPISLDALRELLTSVPARKPAQSASLPSKSVAFLLQQQ